MIMTVSGRIAGYDTNNAGNQLLDSQRIEVASREIQPIPLASKSKASQDGVEAVLFEEILVEPDQSRSKIRVFAIMAALFVCAMRRPNLLQNIIPFYTQRITSNSKVLKPT